MMTCSGNGRITGVAYVPEPLASEIRRLSASLPGESQPHVTLLPPRPLASPAGAVLKAMTGVLQRFEAFEIELGHVCRFVETDIVYLNVAEGYEKVHLLHSELAGQGPVFSEPFEFRPHLTLGGPVTVETAGQRLSGLAAAWDRLQMGRRFRVEEVEFLWLAPDGSKSDWKRLGIYPLKRESPSDGAGMRGLNTQSDPV